MEIKQEIVTSIYENHEGKITGPILQEVLLDMVDDYEGKIGSGSIPAELIEKTGSWDDASSWVENNSESVALKSDLEGLATTESLNSVSESLSSSIAAITGSDITGYLTTASYQADSASFDERIRDIDVSGFATTESLNSVSESISGSLEEIRSSIPTDYATEADINAASQSVKQWVVEQNYVPGSTFGEFSQSVNHEIADSINFIGQVSRSVSQSIVEVKDSIPSDYVSETELNATSESVKTWVGEQGYLTEHQDISGLATTESLNSLSESVANDFANLDIPDISGLATTESLNSVSSSLSASIAAITCSVDLSGYLTTASYQTDSASFDSRFDGKVDKSIAYGVDTEASVLSLDPSVDNLFAEITESVTLDISSDPDEGRAVSLTVYNNSENSASLSIPVSINQNAVVCNGVALSEDSYSLNIPAHEYADLVITYVGNTYYIRTSVDLSNVNVDLSGYATTASLNDLSSSVGTISSSIDTRITNVSSSLSASIAEAGDDDLRTFLFYSSSGDPSSVDASKSNVILTATQDTELGFSTIQPDGSTVGLIVYNNSANVINVTIPSQSTAGGNTYNNILNGSTLYTLNETGSVAVQPYAYSDIIITRIGSSLYYKTSIDVNITGSGGSSSPWELGTGTESAVLKNTIYPNSASNNYAVAEGVNTIASGPSCHAEGNFTWAGGEASHTEGYHTITRPNTYAAHAEGYYTVASNQFEHAEGMWNSTSSGQVFSVGIGNGEESRSNAISVVGGLGPGYVFIKGVGGYDGTNPTTGSNDLASYLRNEIGDVSASLAALR